MIALTLSLVLQTSLMAAADHSYTTAFKSATETGRPLVVLIGAEWCPACRTMKHSVVPQLQKQGALGNVSFAIVNTDQESALSKQLMRGGMIPQLVMYHKTDKGWVREQLTGAQSVGDVQAFLRRGEQQSSVAKLTAK
jgi:thioredoxin-like negative regulator of GroEL